MKIKFKNGHIINIPSAEESYKDGFETGLYWEEGYRPGGPWITSVPGSKDSDPAVMKLHLASKENNRQWLLGFDEGAKSPQPKK